MNPCGVGVGDTIEEAYNRAYEADSQSIFGGIVALNRPIGKELAEQLHSIFLEVVIAPEFSQDALDVLQQKKNIRLLEIDMSVNDDEEEFVSVSGGYLVQEKDHSTITREDMKVVTDEEPTEAQWDAMLLGWKVVAAVKSNAVSSATHNKLSVLVQDK